jgi:hypothetical protein
VPFFAAKDKDDPLYSDQQLILDRSGRPWRTWVNRDRNLFGWISTAD